MGIYVYDGILLGAVINPKRIKKLGGTLLQQNEAMILLTKITNKNSPKFSLEEAKGQISSLIYNNHEDAKALCQQSNPYETISDFYFGIFWKWGVRGKMFFDDDWRPLSKKLINSEELMKEDKNLNFGQKIFDVTNKVVQNLKTSEIQLYEVRYFE
jgi:hypothetical protein